MASVTFRDETEGGGPPQRRRGLDWKRRADPVVSFVKLVVELGAHELGALLPAAYRVVTSSGYSMSARFRVEEETKERQPLFTPEACLDLFDALVEGLARRKWADLCVGMGALVRCPGGAPFDRLAGHSPCRPAVDRPGPRPVRRPVADRRVRAADARGDLRTYKIHLGSGDILMAPDDAYLCVVPGGRGDHVFLPFEEDGGMLSVILSKALLLAADSAITDPTITRQIHG
ncbi:DUF7737 domain-containing protein [Nonomuraea montanisoli]|uniref:DUF7737 domain-containing protein n=1 Tax=Nonomuraea montanisoli TaxID=2741721 RepID=UPI001F30CB41|nr:hypothetical protein [Nonomuraea montanisoli]